MRFVLKDDSFKIFFYSILAFLPDCITVPPLEVKVIRDKKDVIFEFYDQTKNNDKEFPFVIHLEVFREECMISKLEDEGQCSVWSAHINWPPRKRIRYGEMQEGMDSNLHFPSLGL